MTTSAIEQIVDAYVRLKNIQPFDDLQMHRQRLIDEFRGKSGFDFSLPINQIEQEIAVIEAGLARISGTSDEQAT